MITTVTTNADISRVPAGSWVTIYDHRVYSQTINALLDAVIRGVSSLGLTTSLTRANPGQSLDRNNPEALSALVQAVDDFTQLNVSIRNIYLAVPADEVKYVKAALQ